MKFCRRPLIVAVYTALLFPLYSQAQLYNYSYTDTRGTKVNAEPTREYLNPGSAITLNLISGLDRYERVTVTRSSDNVQMFQSVTGLVTVADRITAADGSEYYGKSMTLPVLGEGTFSLKSETLDNKSNVVATTSYSFSIDITPPVLPDPMQWIRAGFQYGSLDIFGDRTATQAISLSNVSDARSGLDKAEWFAIDSSGVRRTVNAQLNALTGVVQALAAVAAGSTVAPVSPAYYTVGFRVYDKAGNWTETSHRSGIDRTIPSYIQHQVRNAKTGVWEDYVPGMTIFENPVKFRYKRLKSDSTNFNGTDFGWVDQITNSDNTYFYTEATVSYPETYMYYELHTKAGLNVNLQYKTLKFTPGNGVAEAPRYLSGQYHFRDANTWTSSDIVRFTGPDCVDLGSVNVEPRSYVQTATIVGIGSCNVSVGESSCQVSMNYCKTSGKGYVPYQIHIRGTGSYANLGGLQSHFYTYWDMNAPVINSIVSSPLDKTVVMLVTDSDVTNDWTNYMWATNIFNLTLKDTSNKVSTLSPKNVTVLNYQLKQVTFDYSALPSGKYTATGAATDTYNNTAELTLSNTILHDVTPPVVDISFEGKQADGALVKGLENLVITLADDMTKASLKSITLSGGPTSDKVSVGWYSQGTDKYGLNYPRIFPATDDADSYQLTAVAVDEAGNTTTKVSRFRYVPNNLIEFNTLKTLAVGMGLKTSDNQPLAYLRTNSIRKKDGSLITGAQTGTLTVRKDAAFAVSMNGVAVVPGDSKDITIDFGQGDGVLIPIFPATSGNVGESSFMIELPQIQ
ncbi:Ig-like domain-containing protein [Escherichia coli]|uniref:DUF4165 domain-containing protein n=1 Tax=Escherichia coli TaxID=562 RepID=A0A2K9YVN4_ECOLX|nr:Ig-like domain-containing protein [Escherichia coli]EBB1606869.1 DUF4165 domain-containing protein [Salmonella enterica]AUW39356.1 DUF4165 domain-containing protein [Escherichia coli]EFK5785279.1 DUF4165 domain-containing protein [Escherichia coli]EFL1374447.1 DUF4165 domain-containing protein [Escherichia coli]EGZ7549518.1 DUF4165 domain-containing protein [Escherichia coli]